MKRETVNFSTDEFLVFVCVCDSVQCTINIISCTANNAEIYRLSVDNLV